jgi:hypothetical protein
MSEKNGQIRRIEKKLVEQLSIICQKIAKIVKKKNCKFIVKSHNKVGKKLAKS